MVGPVQAAARRCIHLARCAGKAAPSAQGPLGRHGPHSAEPGALGGAGRGLMRCDGKNAGIIAAQAWSIVEIPARRRRFALS
nr:hypothetical protein XACLD7_7490001 [Xanthomonas citri pv. citri]